MKERETLGSILKRERELKNISLKELAQKTKVREHFLKAIEENQYEVLPSPVYIKGFLSTYAKSVGLDPHEILLHYEWSLKGEPIIPPEVAPEGKPKRKEKKKHESKPGKRPPWKPLLKFISDRKQIWIVSGVIAIGFLISYFFHPYLSGPPVESPPKTQEASETLPIPPSAQSPDLSLTVERKSFSLELRAIEETWIQIQVDGQLQTETLFKPGEGSSYQATNRIELLIGNAGGLDLVYNGRMMERFGKSGEVVTLVFTPQGVEMKR